MLIFCPPPEKMGLAIANLPFFDNKVCKYIIYINIFSYHACQGRACRRLIRRRPDYFLFKKLVEPMKKQHFWRKCGYFSSAVGPPSKYIEKAYLKLTYQPKTYLKPTYQLKTYLKPT